VRRRLLLSTGWLVLGIAWGVLAAEPPDKSTALWSIGKVARCSDAEPGAGDKATDDPSAKYLHVRIALPAGSGDLKLHQFGIVDDNGKSVAEIYGFHKGRAVLVFEGDWSRLEGLSLEGAGHREPLIPAPPRQKPIAKGEPKPPSSPGEPEPPVVMPRRSPHRAGSGKLDGVELATPAEPGGEEKVVRARRDRPKRPAMEALPSENGNLYQEVLVTQHTRCNIQGLDFDGDLKYRVLSSLTVDQRNPDGGLSVTQKVEQAEVIRADALTQTIVGGLLGKLVGTTFQIAVGPDGRVIDFQGAKGRIRADAGNNPLGGQSFLMASIIDPDGWREIADLTFFRPQTPASGDQKWERPVKHSWGPLGSWSGRVAYARAGQKDSLDRVRYTYNLAYQAPKGDAGGLPFQISRADFKHREAGGSIEFDNAKGRVVKAEEHFPVKGSLTMGLLGQDTPVALEETQDFRVRILEATPRSGPTGSREPSSASVTPQAER